MQTKQAVRISTKLEQITLGTLVVLSVAHNKLYCYPYSSVKILQKGIRYSQIKELQKAF